MGKSNAQLIVVRHLSDGIYASDGGGKSVVFSRWGSGPRGLKNAITSHEYERGAAFRQFGNIGAGAGWIEAVPYGGNPGDGVRIDHPLFGLDDGLVTNVGGEPFSWWKERYETLQREHDAFVASEQEGAL